MRRCTWLALAVVAMLVVPATALADKSYTISQAGVNVTVARNGEVLMREDLTFSFDGFFTGAYRDIPLAPGVTADDVEVSEAGLWIREHDAVDVGGVVRGLRLDSRHCVVMVGSFGADQVQPPWRAISKLLRGLPADARCRARLVVRSGDLRAPRRVHECCKPAAGSSR